MSHRHFIFTSRRTRLIALTSTVSLTVCLIVSLTFSCGGKSRQDLHPSDPTVPLQVVHASELDTYALADATCDLTNEKPETIQSVSLDRWHDGTLGRDTQDVAGLNIHANPLTSDAIDGLFMDGIFRRFCDTTISGPPKCALPSQKAVGWRQIAGGAPIKACHSRMAPPRGSIEHLALSAATAIESAAINLKSLLPAGTIIPKLSVLIVPRFETYWSPWTQNGQAATYQEVLADNLSYFPNTTSTPPYIAIFPKQRTGGGETVNLWESAFIVSHEFGHHVERSLHLDHFDETRSSMRIAVSEGFADTIAFTSQGLSSQSLKAIPCVGVDRAPEVLEFNSGVSKIIDAALLARATEASTVSFQEFQSEEPCRGTLPFSPHGLGAIFAHWLFELASYTPSYDTNAKATVANIAVEWLSQVESRIGAGGALPEQDLEKIVRAMEAAIKLQFRGQEHPLTENIRLLLRQKITLAFPTLKDRTWFSGEAEH
jgi:hypothetical protein